MYSIELAKHTLKANTAFMEFITRVALKCGPALEHNHFQLLINRISNHNHVIEFFKILRSHADWSPAMPDAHSVLSQAFYQCFPFLTFTPEQKTWVQFFSYTSFKDTTDSFDNLPEGVTLRDWARLDKNHTFNTRLFYETETQKEFNKPEKEFRTPLAHYEYTTPKIKKCMESLTLFLRSCGITDLTLSNFICRHANQNGLFSISEPFIFAIHEIMFPLPISQRHSWVEEARTFAATSNSNYLFPALDITLTLYYQYKQNAFEAADANDNSIDVPKLNDRYPRMIGAYTLIAIDGIVHFINPTFDIPQNLVNSSLLKNDFLEYFRKLETEPSTFNFPVIGFLAPIFQSSASSVTSTPTSPTSGPCVIS